MKLSEFQTLHATCRLRTDYLPTLTNRQTNKCLSGLSLLSFIHILKKEYIFLFTAKVHVCLSKFGDRLPEKENPKEKRDKPALCDRCVL